MNPPAPTPFTEHQIARRLRRLELVLVWLAGLFCGQVRAARFDPAPRNGRARRRACSFLWRAYGEAWARPALMRMSKLLGCLIMLRAINLIPSPRPRLLAHPLGAPPGFARRRATPGVALRAAIGSALRRRLRGRGLAARLSMLFAALQDAEALARRLALRLARRLTRLARIIAVRPPADLILSCAAPAPAAADSS